MAPPSPRRSRTSWCSDVWNPYVGHGFPFEDLNAEDVNHDSLADLISLDRHDNVVLIELNTSPKNGADLRVAGSANPVPAI